MPLNIEELIEAALIVAEKEDLKVAVNHSVAGAAFTGVSTLMGGLVGGPIGMGIGGTLSSLAVAAFTTNKFKSVVSIIREDLSSIERKKLSTHLALAVRDLDITDLMGLVHLMYTNENVYTIILKVIITFIETEKRYKIMK